MFITAEVRMMTAVVKIKHRRKDTDHTSPGGSVCAMSAYVCVPSASSKYFPPKGRNFQLPLFKVPENLSNRGVCDFLLSKVCC